MLEQTEVDVSGLLKLTLVIIMNQLGIIKKNNGDLITFTRVYALSKFKRNCRRNEFLFWQKYLIIS